MATIRLHTPVQALPPAQADQRARYAALSRALTRLAQLPDTFMCPDLRNYQATVAELICEGRA